MPRWAALLSDDPRTAGPYTVVGRLGVGGQGTVYAGTGPDGERVAIKVLHSHLALDERARTRFLGEVEAAKRVARFCTVQVLGSGVLGHRPYIVSEFVDGPSLHNAVAADGPRTGAALDRLAISTATALAAIHRAGIVHRDFKPANVLLGPDGPVVIDFGIARALTSSLSTTSQVVGSPAYMAPEQISNASTGPPADMFAWGVTMVYAAGGAKAFTGDSIPAIMQAILHDEPDLGPLTGQLRDLVHQCLAKDPADRPTAEDVAATLLEQPPITLETALTPPPAKPNAPALPTESEPPNTPSGSPPPVPPPGPPPKPAEPDTTLGSPPALPSLGSVESAPSGTASGSPSPVPPPGPPPHSKRDAGSSEASGLLATQAAGLSSGLETQSGSGRGRRWRRPVVVSAVAAAAVLLAGVTASDWLTSPEDDRDVAGTERAMQNGPSAPVPMQPEAKGETPAPGSSASRPGAAERSSGPSASPSPERSSDGGGRSKQPSRPTPKPSKKATAPGKPIGSMPYSVLDPYCRAHGYARSATLVNGPFCVTAGNKFVPINMNSVCRWRFPAYPKAVLQSYNSVGGSWTCLSS
ncbi:serine/threonine-protein kinase [Actinomadura fulvescens]|uniref:Protein kinase domain-containing protein n=1 Tax=Actinomadura fulvescens TaxID=46160 RepID=A0ABN3PUY4_9ACTN